MPEGFLNTGVVKESIVLSIVLLGQVHDGIIEPFCVSVSC